MVEAYIVEHGNLGREQGNRAVAFVDLRHEHFPLPDPRAGEWRVTRHKILHHCAVHNRRVKPCLGQYPADHASDGRFAAGPAHRYAARRGVEEVGQQFGAGHALAAQGIGLGDIGYAVLDRSRGNQDLVAANQPAAVLRKQLDAKALQPFEFRAQPPLIERAVGTRHGRACIADDIGERQHARTTDAAEEIGFVFVHGWRLLGSASFGNGALNALLQNHVAPATAGAHHVYPLKPTGEIDPSLRWGDEQGGE